VGCACLRGGGRHWADRGAGRTAAGGWQQGGFAHQLDPVGPHAGAQLLRSRGHADAIWLGDSEAQPDADPDSDAVGIGQPLGDRDRQRLGDPVPVAFGDDVTLTERQPESVGLALAGS
jgi:hypothetical protein